MFLSISGLSLELELGTDLQSYLNDKRKSNEGEPM